MMLRYKIDPKLTDPKNNWTGTYIQSCVKYLQYVKANLDMTNPYCVIIKNLLAMKEVPQPIREDLGKWSLPTTVLNGVTGKYKPFKNVYRTEESLKPSQLPNSNA